MARVSFTRTLGKELGVEYIRETLADGEELVLLDESEAETLYEGPDPRRVALRLRRDALAPQQPSSSNSKPTGH
jgi:hypothetical protein